MKIGRYLVYPDRTIRGMKLLSKKETLKIEDPASKNSQGWKAETN